MTRLDRLEERIKKLESKALSGRPALRLESAKSFLMKTLKDGKPKAITDLITASGISQHLLNKARKELGYEVFRDSVAWYYRRPLS